MKPSAVYVIIAVIAFLAIIALLFFVKNKGANHNTKILSPLASLAFVFVLAGIFFGNERWFGYVFMGIGFILAIVDAFRKSKRAES